MSDSATEIFVDRLGSSEAVGLFRYVFSHRVRKIRYGSATRWGGRAIRALLRGIPGLVVNERAFDQSTLLQRGGAVYYTLQEVAYDVANTIAARLEERRSALDLLPMRIDPKRRRSFLRTLIVQQAYRSLLVGLLAQEDAAENPRVVLVSAPGLAGEIDLAMRRHTPNVRYVGVPGFRDGFGVRAIWFLGSQLARLPRSFRGRSSSGAGATVGIAHNWGLWGAMSGNDGEVIPRDLWWYVKTGLPPERCLMVFGRTKLTEHETKESAAWLQERGYRMGVLPEAPYAIAHGAPLATVPGPLRIIRDLLHLATALRVAARREAGRWQASTYLRLLFHVRAFETWLRQENVRLWFDAADSSMDIGALACDEAGAVKIGMQWSAEVLPTARTGTAQQLKFVSGGTSARVYAAGFGGADVLVQVGGMYQVPQDRNKEFRLPAFDRLTPIGGPNRFVVAVFDRSAGPGNLLSLDELHFFYDGLISWAEKDFSVGLLIKPKKELVEVLAGRDSLHERLSDLQAEGRAALVSPGVPPRVAALTSDVALALGVSSAGVETMVAGVPTLFVDPTRAREGPQGRFVHDLGWVHGELIFDDLRQALVAIDIAREGGPPISIPPAVVVGLDRFSDGDSAARVGNYLSELIVALDRGGHLDAAMKQATQRYATVYGEDYVIRLDH